MSSVIVHLGQRRMFAKLVACMAIVFCMAMAIRHEQVASGEDGTNAKPLEYDPSRFEITKLAGDLQRPMELTVANDGKIYYIELGGQVKRLDPTTGKIDTLADIKTFGDQENGLIGIALDPNFDKNNWIYLQYSPPDYPGQHISRFILAGDKLDMESEKLLFKFEEQRKQCCHHAGSMTFGPNGDLYIGTGDNTHPHGASGGYAPIDERPNQSPWDAQKSAANSRSGSGKILRIRPTPDGKYEIPDGNLFPKDGSQGLPEIYCMGCRNPWRISVDPKNGFVYWGEVGPDAGGDGPRGPCGYDEINQARGAGNFGWPYFIGNNFAYADYDFTTNTVGPKFDPAAPVNDSPNNTGAKQLPPAQPAFIYYPYGASKEFPEVNGPGGRTACAGPVYHFDEKLPSPTKFPKAFDNTLFIYEWSRNWIKAVHLDTNGNILKIEPFMQKQRFARPIDMTFGPDGSLYVIEYGDTWGVNKNAQIIRIDYMNGNRKPIAKANVSNNTGRIPLDVKFSSEGTYDKDANDTLKYEWRSLRAGDDAAKAEVISTEANPTVSFDKPGVYNVELRVADSSGAFTTASVPVIAGNARPDVRIVKPLDGSFFDADKPVDYEIEVNDFEDGTSNADLADEGNVALLDRDAPGRVTLNVAWKAEGAAEGDQGPIGMRLMKGSDCFNCHALDQKRVGPAFIEIANKYRVNPNALNDSVKRVREGSSGVWGKIPMIPHSQHTDDELHKMVEWIYSLEPTGNLRVLQGFRGKAPVEGNEKDKLGSLVLEATYLDRGVEGLPPLSHSATVTLHNRHWQAEHASEIQGPKILGAKTAEEGNFLGSINHGHYAKFSKVALDHVSALRTRLASAGAGGKIEVRLDKPNGELIATIDVEVNGQWEEFYERTTPITKTSGVRDLYLVFVNPANGSGLMNLDSVRFEP